MLKIKGTTVTCETHSIFHISYSAMSLQICSIVEFPSSLKKIEKSRTYNLCKVAPLIHSFDIKLPINSFVHWLHIYPKIPLHCILNEVETQKWLSMRSSLGFNLMAPNIPLNVVLGSFNMVYHEFVIPF